MKEPEDHESKPSSPKQAGGDEGWLPPRLRDKLGDAKTGGGSDDEFDFMKKKSDPAGLIITLVIALAAVGGGWWFWNDAQTKAKDRAARAAFVADSLAAVAYADSIAAVARADSIAAVARADSIAFAKLPKWKRRQIWLQRAKAAGSDTVAANKALAAAAALASDEPMPMLEAGPYALDAGQFLFEDAATKKADELRASTNLEARVVSVGQGGSASFHVYLGRYNDALEAQKAAGDLLGKGLVQQAAVVASKK